MCGRFSLISDSKSIEEHFNLTRSCEFIHSYNISPANNIAVVRLENDKRVLANMHWGLVPHWAKDTRLKPINAKSETIDTKPFFRSALKKNRCLIPANGFYEWKQTNKHKQPWYFKLKDADLMAFGAIWDHWEQNGTTMDSCTIITTFANDVMKPVHDRMPVILEPEKYDEWLIEGNKALLLPYTGEMIAYPVSTIVNNPKHNGKDLIKAI